MLLCLLVVAVLCDDASLHNALGSIYTYSSTYRVGDP